MSFNDEYVNLFNKINYIEITYHILFLSVSFNYTQDLYTAYLKIVKSNVRKKLFNTHALIYFLKT